MEPKRARSGYVHRHYTKGMTGATAEWMVEYGCSMQPHIDGGVRSGAFTAGGSRGV